METTLSVPLADGSGSPAHAGSNFLLLLVDGLNIVRRVYGGNPAEDSDEKAAAAVRASMGSFRRAFKEHRPTHVLFAFDAGGSTWRHELFPGYHQDRKPMPEPLRRVLPGLLDELRAHGCFVAQPTGVEADDVIVAVAHRARAKGIPSVVLSTDKDLASQACDLIRVRDHFAREWHDEAWCRAKFGVELSQLLDYLALVGDAVDGVQGVDKVGAKTAARLLTEHGTLEAVIGAAPTLKGVVGRNLQQQADRARLARRLVSFKVDAELGIDSFSQLRAPTAFA